MIETRIMQCPQCGSHAEYIQKGIGIVMCARRMDCLWSWPVGRKPEREIIDDWVAQGLPLLREHTA